MTKSLNIYFASPLFSEMEQLYNAHVVKKLRDQFNEQVNIYLPQENDAINDKSNYASSIQIADGDNAYLEKSDLLIAVLDGVAMDAGVASEIGYFYSMNKPIIGVYSDIRQGANGNQAKLNALDEVAESPFSYVNLYTVGLVKKRGTLVTTVDQLIEEIEKLINK
ncbi:nucleoside 2-deoxyribosyltransferase [Alkalibacterium sp. MB6]|uniref:nucleoside 2-deoxyribosyltransferase n=1 Tax=Alkalibacterium sp. MB6 TaxID=2081965 RepID=UPI00137A2C8A|nr:nucleoside 2-deoxyribosyltransferase [Alkalibacterium sp. MB6]